VADLSFIGKSLKTLFLKICKYRSSPAPAIFTDTVSTGVFTDDVKGTSSVS